MRPRIVPIGLVSRGVAIVERKPSALPVPYAMEFPDRVPQGALLRPGLLRDGGRALVAAGVADGVPARGDPAAARLRRVRDPRPVDHRAAHRRHGRARVPERVPPPRREGRRRARDRARAGSRARSTAGATASTARTRSCRARSRSPSTTCNPTTSTSRRCAARCGAVARGSTSTTTRRRCGSASSRTPPSSTRGRWSRCARSGGTRAGSP